MVERLRASPTTKLFMEDSVFLAKLEELRAEPTKLMKYVQLVLSYHSVYCIYKQASTFCLEKQIYTVLLLLLIP